MFCKEGEVVLTGLPREKAHSLLLNAVGLCLQVPVSFTWPDSL